MEYKFITVPGMIRQSPNYTEEVVDVEDVISNPADADKVKEIFGSLALSKSAVIRKMFKDQTIIFGRRFQFRWELRALCLDTLNEVQTTEVLRAFIEYKQTICEQLLDKESDTRTTPDELCNSYIIEPSLKIVFCYNRVLSTRLFALLQSPKMIEHQVESKEPFLYRCVKCKTASTAMAKDGKTAHVGMLPMKTTCMSCGTVNTISETLNVTI